MHALKRSLRAGWMVLALAAALAGRARADVAILAGKASDLTQRARSLIERRRFPEAEILLRRVRRIHEALYGREDRRTLTTLRLQADVAAAVGKRDESLHIAREALRVSRSLHGGPSLSKGQDPVFTKPAQDSYRLASARHSYAQRLHREHRTHQAEGHLLRAWKSVVDELGPYGDRDVPDVNAIEAHRTATRYYNAGRYRDAIPLFQRAARTWAMALGEDDPLVLECRWRLARIRNLLGRRMYACPPTLDPKGRGEAPGFEGLDPGRGSWRDPVTRTHGRFLKAR